MASKDKKPEGPVAGPSKKGMPEDTNPKDKSDSEDDDVEFVEIKREEVTRGLVTLVDGTEEWIVEKIVGRKKVNGIRHYFVKWQGWSNHFNSWEPISHLNNCKPMVKRFDKKFRGKSKKTEIKLPTTLDEIKKEVDENVENNDGAVGGAVDLSIIKREVLDDDDNVGEKDGQRQEQTLDNYEDDSDIEIIDHEELGEAEELEHVKKIEAMIWGDTYFMYRRKWDSNEVPLCILGSKVLSGYLLHLVRIQTPEDPEDVLDNPFVGVTEHNVVIVKGQIFRYEFPQLVIKYYEKNCKLFTPTKSEDKLAEVAARAGLMSNLMNAGVNAPYPSMLNDMMPPDQRDDENAIAAMTAAEKRARKFNKRNETVGNKMEDVKDRFGLPYYYEEGVDDLYESENEDSDNSDEWEEVKVTPKSVNAKSK